MINFPEIIIIVGSGRSGTSYLQRTLRDTLDIGFFREPNYIIPVYHQLHRFGDLEKEENLQKLVKRILSEKIFERLSNKKDISNIYNELYSRITIPSYSGILYEIFNYIAEKQGKHRLGYKYPGDIINIPLLAEIFPSARFVHILRDGRDVAISLLTQKWGPTNLYSGSRYWAQRTTRGHEAGLSLLDRYIEIRFEDLILETEETVTILGEFLNRGHNLEQVDRLTEQINKTKNTSSVYNWKTKLTDNQIYMCESAAGPVLQECGYHLKFSGTAKIHPLKSLYYLSTDITSRALQRLS